MPSPGWEAQYDWQGFVPVTAEPKIENPPIGYIATANNDTLPAGYPYFFTYEWETNYRYRPHHGAAWPPRRAIP